MVLSDITNATNGRQSMKLDASALTEKLHRKALQQERLSNDGLTASTMDCPHDANGIPTWNLLLRAEIEELRAAQAEPRTPRGREPCTPTTPRRACSRLAATTPRTPTTPRQVSRARQEPPSAPRTPRVARQASAPSLPGGAGLRGDGTGALRRTQSAKAMPRPASWGPVKAAAKVSETRSTCGKPVAQPKARGMLDRGIAADDVGNSDGPGGRGRKVPARLLLTSQLCSAGERIAKLCEQLHFWQDQSQDLQHDLRQKLAQKAAVDARHERRGALAQRLQQLQGDLRQRREGIQRLKEFPAALHHTGLELHALQACASLRDRQPNVLRDPEQLLRAQEMLQELQVQQEAMRAELVEATRSLQKSWQRLRCQQIRKLYEVRQVYPVQQCNSYWTIRGICLRGTASLRHQDPREERLT
eukprot:s2301_g5.t1